MAINNLELREELKPAAYNQPQITEGSHLIVFAAWENINEQQIDAYLQQIADVRDVSIETLADFRTSLINTVESKSPDERYEWAARQIYIALGTALTAAAVEKVDATPMEGFVPEKVDDILNLREKGLRSVAMMAFGYRDEENDFLANVKKVRRDKEHLFIHLN